MTKLKIVMVTIECTRSNFETKLYASYIDNYKLVRKTSYGYEDACNLEEADNIEIISLCKIMDQCNEGYLGLCGAEALYYGDTMVFLGHLIGEPNGLLNQLKLNFTELLLTMYNDLYKHIGKLGYRLSDIAKSLDSCGIEYKDIDKCVDEWENKQAQ